MKHKSHTGLQLAHKSKIHSESLQWRERKRKYNAIFLENYKELKDNSKSDSTKGLKETNSEKQIILILGGKNHEQNKVFFVLKLTESGG